MTPSWSVSMIPYWVCAICRDRPSISMRAMGSTAPMRSHRASRSLHHEYYVSDFDRQHGVDTGGEFEGWTYLSDLDIPSPNWIDCNDYTAIEPIRFEQVMAALEIAFEDFTFIDFGSGKGLALLLAPEYPFRRIIGLEFAPELQNCRS